MAKKLLSDWKVHALCITFVIIAEFIGTVRVDLGVIAFSLLPMLFVLVFGIVLAILKKIPREMMETASPYISIATLWLISKTGSTIGPNLEVILNAGPALVLQEFGNLGTIFFSLPIAIFVFSMGRQAIGAGFSNSREGSIALVGSMFGLDSPEGQGVLGAYITGTILGTIFFSILASVLGASGLFHPYSLAMAAGTGSASMMAASAAPLVEMFPEMAGEITAYAASSNLLSSVDGLYMSLFLGIPLTKWLYKVLKGEERYAKAEERRAAKNPDKQTAEIIETYTAVDEEQPKTTEKQSYGEIWFLRCKVLAFSGVFALIGNTISTWKAGNMLSPIAGIPAIVLLLLPIILGYLLSDLVAAKTKINAPALLYISLVAIVMGLPFIPGSQIFISEAGKIGLLPLCTPILAYAGISLGKDLDGFRKNGVAIVCVALMAFIGTYVGSAVIAEVVLKMQGLI